MTQASSMTEASSKGRSRIALRLRLDSGPCSIALERVHHVAGYATLRGDAEEYFLGWLAFHGEEVPVFDLNRVVCDVPTPELFGSRIVVLDTKPRIGLLTGGLTDTVAANDPEVPLLNLDLYLPMLQMMIPEGRA